MASLDDVFDLLSEERRRYLLYYLENQDGPVPVTEVVAQVAEWESNDETESVPGGKFEKVKMRLYHADLPKASELTHIRYNADAGTVELAGEPPELRAITAVAKVIEHPDRNS